MSDGGTHGKNSAAERLRAYHLALEFCDMIDEILPKLACSAFLRDQLVRAAESALLNIAEGAGHFSRGKERYHYELAHGSVWEALAAIARVRSRNPRVDLAPLRQKGEMLGVMVMGLIRTQSDRPA